MLRGLLEKVFFLYEVLESFISTIIAYTTLYMMPLKNRKKTKLAQNTHVTANKVRPNV